jgi:hypothetical protein
MNYSVSNLTEVADCNALLTWAGREKADLTFKRTAEERLTVKFAETSVEIDAILQSVLAELAALDTIIAALPDGPIKDDQIKIRTKKEYKRFLLVTRRETYGIIALLQKEYEVSVKDQEIEEIDAFIAAIEAHRDTLTPAA